MNNIKQNVNEKMKKMYSFSGTQLLITGVGLVVLLSVLACAGRYHRAEKETNSFGNNDRRQEMLQGTNRPSDRRQEMRRGQRDEETSPTDSNPAQNPNQAIVNPAQATPPTPQDITTGTGNE